MNVFGTCSSRSSDSEISENGLLLGFSNDPIEIQSKSSLDGIWLMTCNLVLIRALFRLLFFSMSSKLFIFVWVPTIWWSILFYSFLEAEKSSNEEAWSGTTGFATIYLSYWSHYYTALVTDLLLATGSLVSRGVGLYGLWLRFKTITIAVNNTIKLPNIIPIRRLRFPSAIIKSSLYW